MGGRAEKSPRASRMFTDREDLRGAYHKLVQRCIDEEGANWYVIDYYGVGGVGKTTLLEKLRREVAERAAQDQEHRHIVLQLDFENEKARDMLSALQLLKDKLQQEGFDFPLYELARCALYEKSGRVLSKSEREDFFDKNPLVDSLVDVAGQVLPLAAGALLPTVGLVVSIGKTLSKLAGRSRAAFEGVMQKRKKCVYDIETMDRNTLLSNMPFFFATDVNDHMEKNTVLHLFIDTYEALNSYAEGRDDRWTLDDWVHGEYGLIQILTNTVVAIAGREKLRWAEKSEFWEKWLDAHITDHLSEEDSSYFLESCGVPPELWHDLYVLTGGEPVYLDLCVTQYEKIKNAGRRPSREDFGKNVEDLVKRYLRYTPRHLEDALYLMAGMRRWNKEIFDCAMKAADVTVQPSEYTRQLTQYTFVSDCGDGVYSMHQVIASVIVTELSRDLARKASAALAAYVQNHEDSELALEAAISLAGEDGQTVELAEALEKMAKAARKKLQFERALQLREQAADVYRKVLGEEDPETLRALGELAISYDDIEDYARAMVLKESVYDAQKRILGEEHPDTLRTLGNLAVSYMHIGNEQHTLDLHERALEMNARVYEAQKRVLGEEHLDTLSTLENLAVNYNAIGDMQGALELNERVYEARKRILGEEHPETLSALVNLAGSYSSTEDYQRALELNERAYEAQKRILGAYHPDTQHSLIRLAIRYINMGNFQHAMELEERAYEVQKQIFGEEHPKTLEALENLADKYGWIGEQRHKLELCERLYELRKRILGVEHLDTLRSLEGVAMSHNTLQNYARALELELQVYEARKRTQGEDHPDTRLTEEWIEQLRRLL